MEKRNGFCDIASQIGARIEARRLERGLSLRDVAQMADCSTTYLSRMESGCLSMQVLTLEKIARALQVEPFDLLNYDPKNDDVGYVVEKMRQYPKTRAMVKAKAEAWPLRGRGRMTAVR